MQRHLGETFTGIVSSVTKFGVFVVLRQFNVDGLVKIEELANEYLEFDQENMCLVGRKSGYTITIGDEMDIVIAATNIDLGQIDFTLANKPPERVKREPEKADKPKREMHRKSKSKATKSKGAGFNKKKKAAKKTRAKKRKKSKSNR
ncbi:MAG: S1 RNA-binding domain-containing protein [Bdellovibrionales bacterium]